MIEEIKTPISVSGSVKDLRLFITALDNAIASLIADKCDLSAGVLIEWRDIAKEQLKDETYEQQNPK